MGRWGKGKDRGMDTLQCHCRRRLEAEDAGEQVMKPVVIRAYDLE
jgi:hypothetical protein